MLKKLKEEFLEMAAMPDIQAFAQECLDIIEKEAPTEAVLEAFYDQVFRDWNIQDTREYMESRNYMRSFSLVFWTELHDGADDYSDHEKRFMRLFMKYMAPRYPDLLHHENTRLGLFSNN